MAKPRLMVPALLVAVACDSCGGKTASAGGPAGVSATDAAAHGDAASDVGAAERADAAPGDGLVGLEAGLLLLEALPPVLDACAPPIIGIEPILSGSCTYPVPGPDSGADLNRVVLVYTASDQTHYGVEQNDSAVCDIGWHYVNNQTQIELCGATCDYFKSNPGGEMDLYFGCFTKGSL
jgi:hypothetical protein